MSLGARIATVSLLAIALVSTTATTALAETQTVETPAGTFYVEESHETGDLDGDHTDPIVCQTLIGNIEFCPPQGRPDPDPAAHVGLWMETNGCEGLQREPVDCDLDRAIEPADENLLAVGV